MRPTHPIWRLALETPLAAVALAAIAGAGTRDLHVAVWGLDGELLEGATVALVTADGTCKGTGLPDGCQLVTNEARKGRLVVAHDVYGGGALDVHLPPQTPVLVDIVYIAPGEVEFLLDAPRVKQRTTQGFDGLAPVNDLCQDATPLATGSPSGGTTVGATYDPDLPECETFVTAPGVWYSIEGTGAMFTASTCGFDVGYDTKLSVFCGDCELLYCVGANDDSCPADGGLRSEVAWCTRPGQTYWILVHGFAANVGDFGVIVTSDFQNCQGPAPCSAAGACCLPDGTCVDGQSFEACLAMDGEYRGQGSICGGGVVDYEVQVFPEIFEDISGIGLVGPSGDDESTVVPLGFSFPFYDQVITEVRMSTNGYLTTGMAGEEFSNAPCADDEAPNGAMFVLWDDFDLNDGGATYWTTAGVAPNRVFVAQWSTVAEWGTGGMDIATFQVRLRECCSRIEYCYQELEGVPSFPGDATVGLESPDGLLSHCVPEDWVAEDVCIRFEPLFQGQVDCDCRTLGFETEDDAFTPLLVGQDLTSPPEFGNLITLRGYGSGVVSAAIFDSDVPGPCVGGPDPDLLVGLGNIVILQSVESPAQSVPGFFDVPNDASTGGVIEIEFLEEAEPRSVTLIDICEPDSSTQVFLFDHQARTRTYLVPGGWTTDITQEGGLGYGVLDLQSLAPQPGAHGTAASAANASGFEPDRVVRMEIHLGGSGAIDDLEFCTRDQE